MNLGPRQTTERPRPIPPPPPVHLTETHTNPKHNKEHRSK